MIMTKAKADDNVVQDRHNVARVTDRQAGLIFMEGNITAIMKTVLNSPIPAHKTEQLIGRSLLRRQSRDAIHHFAGSTLLLFVPDDPLQAKGLLEPRPLQIVIELRSDPNRPLLSSPMTLIDL